MAYGVSSPTNVQCAKSYRIQHTCRYVNVKMLTLTLDRKIQIVLRDRKFEYSMSNSQV